MRIKQMKLKNKNGMNIYGFHVKSDNFPGPGLVESLCTLDRSVSNWSYENDRPI